MKSLLFIIPLFIAASALGQTTLHEFQFADEEFISFTEERKCEIRAHDVGIQSKLSESIGRKIKSANYISGIKIRTNDPDRAADAIFRQISNATKIKITPFSSSGLKKAKPSTIMTGIGVKSVWSIFITPAEGGDYILTISYVIEDENGG
jgi:hypothetical protein